jgi:hypothetical protein
MSFHSRTVISQGFLETVRTSQNQQDLLLPHPYSSPPDGRAVRSIECPRMMELSRLLILFIN